MFGSSECIRFQCRTGLLAGFPYRAKKTGQEACPTGTRKPQCYHLAVDNAGYVLVGGRSSRMGCDKALLPFRGGALAQSVAQVVSQAAGSATLVGDPGRYAGLGYPVVPDLFPGEGPLGGIVTALWNTNADWNLITACDMPQLEVDLLCGLLEIARAQPLVDALVPVGPEGRPEPLPVSPMISGGVT